MTLFRSVISFLLLFWWGCDKGLDPTNVEDPGFGGTITYLGVRPPADSLRDLRIVAVPYFPLDSTFQPLIMNVVQGVIPFSSDLRTNIDSGKSVPYTMFVKPQTYYYIAVVQQFGLDPFSQWKVVGVYTMSPSSTIPKVLTISDGVFTPNINMTVDFDHLPPQPFRVP